MKVSSFLMCAAIFLLAGCQPELLDLPENPLPVDSCRIKTAYYYGGSGGINDTANFLYSAGKLMKVEGERADVNYSYNSNRISAMRYFEKPGDLLYRIDSFYYINDTVISKIIINDYDMYNHNDTIRAVLDFTYNGTRLSTLRTVYNYEGSTDTDTSISAFRWTGDNVTSLFTTSTVWADDSVYYQYDNNPNYFRNVSSNFLMADPFFQLYVGIDPHLPLFLSRNNAVNYVYYTNVNYPLEYQVDSMSHPTLVRSGGFDYMGYKYECP